MIILSRSNGMSAAGCWQVKAADIGVRFRVQSVVVSPLPWTGVNTSKKKSKQKNFKP